MRMLVCGGRSFRDYGLMQRELMRIADEEGEATTIVHGDAPGADRLADHFASFVDVPVERFPADWKKDGRKAGPLRNAAMLASGIDLVVAFPGGKGTADMVARAKKAGVKVIEISKGAQS